MIRARSSIYIDKYRPLKSGKCAIKIRVYYNGDCRYFKTDIFLTEKELKKILKGNNNGEASDIESILYDLLEKAKKIIKNLKVFNFETFESRYYDYRDALTSVSFAFDQYIKELEQQNRLSTADGYRCAKKSFEKFKKNLKFEDITAPFLKRYEAWMLEKKLRKSTIGIYGRYLRAIYRQQNLPQSIYPFGVGRDKWQIPTSRNVKKALDIEDIKKIYQYKAPLGSAKERAKDYWLFTYYTAGINLKDICLLKWGNIDGNLIKYIREKTKRSNKESKLINVPLQPEAMEIIRKWGHVNSSNDTYIFPHFNNEMSPKQQYNKVKYLTKNINRHMKAIAKELGINDNITTYSARHSFATILNRNGMDNRTIGTLYGHGSLYITEGYIDFPEIDQLHKATDVLTLGLRNTK